MFSRIAKLSKALLTVGIFAFLAVGFLSLSHFSMGMNGEMDMSDCPFMNEMVICDMSALEHLTGWHNIFSNILTPEIIVLTIVLLAVVALPHWRQFFLPPKNPYLRLHFVGPNDISSIINIFQYLFSQGILNPKLF